MDSLIHHPNIGQNLNFSKKIDLYKKIFPVDYGSNPRSKKQSEIINALGRVNSLRNDVAHGLPSSNRSSKDAIILFNFKHSSKSGEIRLDDNTIRQFEKDKKYLLREFIGQDHC